MFATYIPYIGGRFIVIGLSAKGTEYVEEYLLSKQEKLVDSLSDTDKSIKSGAKFEIDFGILFHDSLYKYLPHLYRT